MWRRSCWCPRAGWLLLEHAQHLREAFSNTATVLSHPSHSSWGAESQGEQCSWPPSPWQNSGGIWEHACLWLSVMSENESVAQSQNAPAADGDTANASRLKPKGLCLSVEHHYLCCSITEAWQMPLSPPSPNGNVQQLSLSCLSPRNSVQKLMAQHIPYSCVASSPDLLC